MKKLAILTVLSTMSACSSINVKDSASVVVQKTNHKQTKEEIIKNTVRGLLIFTEENQKKENNNTDTQDVDKKIIQYKGVIDTKGKIIIPAQYTAFDIYTVSKKGLQIVATGKKGYPNKYIADMYDLKGNLLKESVTTPLMKGFAPKIVSFKLKPNKSYSDMVFTAANELKHIKSTDKQRELLESDIKPRFMDLYDHTTGHRTPLFGKNIRSLEGINSVHVKTGLFPAVHSKTYLSGFIDKNAHWVIPPQYHDIVDISGRTIPPNMLAVVQPVHDVYVRSCYAFLTLDKKLLGRFSHFDNFKKSDFDGKLYAFAERCSKDYNYTKGLLNEVGEWAVPPKKDRELLTHPNKKGFITFTNRKTKTIGVLDIKGNIIIPAQYYRPTNKNRIWQNSHPDIPNLNKQGLFAVSKERDSEYYGFINAQNEWIIPPILATNSYNSYAFNADGHAHSYIKNMKGRRIIDKKGKDVYPHIKGSIADFNKQGFAPFSDLKGKMGVINKKGDIILQPTYSGSKHKLYKYNTVCIEQALPDTEHTKPLQKSTKNQEKKQSLCGVIDASGTSLIPSVYKEVQTFKNFAIVETHDKKYGVLDYHNNWLIKKRSTPIKQLITANDIIFKAIYRP